MSARQVRLERRNIKTCLQNLTVTVGQTPEIAGQPSTGTEASRRARSRALDPRGHQAELLR